MTTNGKTHHPALKLTILPELEEMRAEFRDALRDLWDTRWPLSRLRPRKLEIAEPAVDMFERDGNIVVKAEMPGIQPDKVDVTVSDNELRISGERKEEHEVKEENYYRSERSFGHIFRSVTLPEGCNTDAVTATAKDGVVEVLIPRTPKTAGKKVEVTAAPS
ncbi:MAG TPA: Hsp20/alpha crystallin family protein [Dehalococcoidia bacterium]|nr:Hsp20/alpha crystallin family protein [Dehalococcoidia bacterium]